MKKLIMFTVLAMLALSGYAQKIFQDLSWDEAAALAEKKGKIILVDAMRKPMNAEGEKALAQQQRAIFSVKEVVDFV